LALGAADLALIYQFVSILGAQSTLPLILIIILLFFIPVFRLINHFRIRYILTAEELIIEQLFNRRILQLKDVKQVSRHRLSFSETFLTELYPTYTVRDGLMIKLTDGRQVFVSPNRSDGFMRRILSQGSSG